MTEHSPLQEQIIREALNDYRCQYTLDASDDSGSMLVDILTPDGDDVDSGIREMDLLAEHIAVSIDDKIDQLKSENAELRKQLNELVLAGYVPDKVAEDNRRLKEQVVDLQAHADFFGKLIERNKIGTKETPSLRAYIERIEEQNRVMREALNSISKLDSGMITMSIHDMFQTAKQALDRAGKE